MDDDGIIYSLSDQFLEEKKRVSDRPTYGRMDGPTDGPTNRRTDKSSYRDAWTHLKMAQNCKKSISTIMGKYTSAYRNCVSQPSRGRKIKTKKKTSRQVLMCSNDLSHLDAFLDASTHLYKSSCPSVGRSVGRSVRR